MKYIAVFELKNKDHGKVSVFEASTDDLAKEAVKKIIDRVESAGQIRILGTSLYAIDHFIPT